MVYKTYKSWCVACPEEDAFPGTEVRSPFHPLLILQPADPLTSRAIYPITSLRELDREGPEALLPPQKVEGSLGDFVERHGATVLNPRFPKALSHLEALSHAPRNHLRVTLVGLGDVGGTVLTGLKLLGREIEEIQIFDPNENACRRYEMELNQVLSPEGEPLPRITICPPDRLFDCHLFLFTASRGVPPLGAQGDVRMAQFQANRQMLRSYARQARDANFQGLFCQISDPVDHLCRAVFLESNRDENGNLDFMGLLPHQIQGFGLGVMAARARYAARERGISPDTIRVYGPHGAGLVVANAPCDGYDPAISRLLTQDTRTMNLRVRDLGYKPYIAPGLSSACVSILRLLRGQHHYGAIPLGGVYFGCESVMTPHGPRIFRESLHPELLKQITAAYQELKDFSYDAPQPSAP